jgi:hypothetical protein
LKSRSTLSRSRSSRGRMGAFLPLSHLFRSLKLTFSPLPSERLAIWPGADPRRSSIPFPTTAYPASPLTAPSPPLAAASASQTSLELFSPPVTPPSRAQTPDTPSFTFPSFTTVPAAAVEAGGAGSARYSASFSHFPLHPAPVQKRRERVLRRVTGRSNLSSLDFNFKTASVPPSPPDSPIDIRTDGDDGAFDVDTPTKGRFFATPPPLSPFLVQVENEDVEFDAVTPTPATPSYITAFPSPNSPSPQPRPGATEAILLPSALVALEAVAAREQQRREDEGWTLLAVDGTAERRRSF